MRLAVSEGMRALRSTWAFLCVTLCVSQAAYAEQTAPARTTVTKWSKPYVSAHSVAQEFGNKPGLIHERTRTWRGLRRRLHAQSLHANYESTDKVRVSLLLGLEMTALPAHIRRQVVEILTPEATISSIKTQRDLIALGSRTIRLHDSGLTISGPDRSIRFDYATGLETERRLKALPAAIEQAIKGKK